MLSPRYPASQSLVMFSFVTEEAIHLPPAPDMLRSYGEGENLGAGARGCENGLEKEEEGVGENGRSLSLYKGDVECAPPRLPLEISYLSKCLD